MTRDACNTIDEWFNQQSRSCIFIDADDTIWHDSKYFRIIRAELLRVGISKYFDEKGIISQLNDNLKLCGLGEKEYAKAVKKTALNIGLSAWNMKILQNAIDQFLCHNIEILSNVEETLAKMGKYKLKLLSKGSESEQKKKLSRSNLSEYFEEVIIVDRKDSTYFDRLVKRHALKANQIIVIGNSVRHDIIPAVSIGAAAIWLNHDYNEHGRNEPLPREACEVDSWAQISKVIE